MRDVFVQQKRDAMYEHVSSCSAAPRIPRAMAPLNRRPGWGGARILQHMHRVFGQHAPSAIATSVARAIERCSTVRVSWYRGSAEAAAQSAPRMRSDCGAIGADELSWKR